MKTKGFVSVWRSVARLHGMRLVQATELTASTDEDKGFVSVLSARSVARLIRVFREIRGAISRRARSRGVPRRLRRRLRLHHWRTGPRAERAPRDVERIAIGRRDVLEDRRRLEQQRMPPFA